MNSIKQVPVTDRKKQAVAALGLITVGFVAGLVTPAPLDAQPVWGTLYHNADQTMAICVCDGGDMCSPCWS